MNTRLLPDSSAQAAPPSSLATVQKNFCGYLRDPDNRAAPEGLNRRRLDVYRDLIFNNVESLLSSAYPVLKAIMGEQWQSLIREFFVEHRAATPYFTRLAAEFLKFFEEREAHTEHPDFLTELARHEWLELDLLYREAEQRADAESDYAVAFSDARLKLSSLAVIAQYHYPVHQLSADFIPDKPPTVPTWILMYRNSADKVVFVQLSDLAYQLLALIEQQPGHSAREWMESVVAQLANAMDDQQRDYFVNCGLALLESFFNDGVLRHQQ